MIAFRTLARSFVFAPVVALSLPVGLVGQAAPAGPAAKPVDFARDIAPILRNRCLSCHGPEEQEADLRLDSKQHAFPPDDEDVWTIIPRKPEESVVMERITLPADDPDVMPAEGDPLKPAEVQLVRQWIAAGAVWPEDYTIEPPVRAKLPEETPLLEGLSAEVLTASQAVVDALRDRGVLAGTVAANSQALEVNFSLQGKAIDDSRLADLAGLEPRLVWLNLSNTQVTAAALGRLKSFGELRRLHLARTSVNDQAIDSLLALPKLEYLNLYGTKLTDAGLRRLAEAKALRKLFVWQTEVTAEAVAALRKARPDLAIDDGQDARALLTFIAERKAKAEAERAAKEAQKKKQAAKKAGAAKKNGGSNKAKPNAKAKVVSAPVNTVCPVSGKAAKPEFTAEHKGQLVAFCCGNCRKTFLAEPAKFAGKLPKAKAAAAQAKAAVNTVCPVSGKAVNPEVTADHNGQLVAFCCGNCRKTFLAEPAKFAGKLPKTIPSK